MSLNSFSWPIRVYYEDTDAAGLVYYANYLRFMERARTEWLRARGVHQLRLAEESGVVFAIRRMEVDWILPARLDDVLDVSVHSVRAGATRLSFRQEMSRNADTVLLSKADVEAVCLDAATFKPVRMPRWVRTEINNVE